MMIMKKHMLTGGIALTAIAALFSFSTITQTGITGKVSPADGAASVWAVSGTDTVKGVISAGAFSLAVKAGTYKVIIDAKEPYKDVQLESVVVKDGQPSDVGEIALQQ